MNKTAQRVKRYSVLTALPFVLSSFLPTSATNTPATEIAQAEFPVRETVCRQVASTPSGIVGPGVPYYRDPTDVVSGTPIGRYQPGAEVKIILPYQERRVFDPSRSDIEYVMVLALEGTTAEVWFPANIAMRNGGPPLEDGALVLCDEDIPASTLNTAPPPTVPVAENTQDTACRQIADTPSLVTGPGVPYYAQPTDIETGVPPLGRFNVGEQIDMALPYEERRVPQTGSVNTFFVMIKAIANNQEVWFPANIYRVNGGPVVEKGALIMCQNNSDNSTGTPVRGLW